MSDLLDSLIEIQVQKHFNCNILFLCLTIIKQAWKDIRLVASGKIHARKSAKGIYDYMEMEKITPN